MKEGLESLLSHPRIWQGQHGAGRLSTLPSGYALLDKALPGGGWPEASLIEILVAHYGAGELRLLLPLLVRLSRPGVDTRHSRGWLCWIAPPYVPHAPALAAEGVDVSRILLVHAREGDEVLWAMEQALRSGGCELVMAWSERVSGRQMRCLQLAAEEGKTTGILFRPPAAGRESSPAALRLRLSPGPEGRIEILKSRGGRPGVLPVDDILRHSKA